MIMGLDLRLELAERIKHWVHYKKYLAPAKGPTPETSEGCLAQDLRTQPFRETRFYVRGGVFARESCWARRLRR